MADAATAVLHGVDETAHRAMVALCERCLDERRRARMDEVEGLQRAHGLWWDAVEALRCQMYQDVHKREHREREKPRRLRGYVERFVAGQSIEAIAASERCFSPSTLGRLLVRELCVCTDDRDAGSEAGGRARKQQHGAAGGEAAAAPPGGPDRGEREEREREQEQERERAKLRLLRGKSGKKRERALVTAYLRGTLELPHSGGRGAGAGFVADAARRRRLRAEIDAACAADRECGPGPDRVRHTVGLEHEFVLIERLRNLGLFFQSEEELRAGGVVDTLKTPDVLLLVPVAMRTRAGEWRVVNWIDSKAQFGDPATHSANCAQLEGYVNRFGAGLVLYWYGFVAALNKASADILLMGGLPHDDDIQTL
eukprot:g72.t1